MAKGNSVDVEPKMGDLVVCQLELTTPEVMPLVELLEVLASGKETEELLLDPNSLEGVDVETKMGDLVVFQLELTTP